MTAIVRPTVVFRVDASLAIGTGHIMRCLTLAEALRASGAHCLFVCRAHPGNLVAMIGERGFDACALDFAPPDSSLGDATERPQPSHSDWLGTDWATDADQTRAAIDQRSVDWLIVDHYALDARWERALRPTCRRIMVIDDLADRPHECDLLLDQNLGRRRQDYANLVPSQCEILAGPRYALLRPEFAALRDYSLQRRAHPRLERLLITMGGVDQPDATGKTLEALRTCTLPEDCRITVVMGPHAPWLARVRSLAERMPWPTDVRVSVNDMAQLMADSDLAIGAAGSTAWERCCLGLPTLMVVLAKNQRDGAAALVKSGASLSIGGTDDAGQGLCAALEALADPAMLIAMSIAASGVTDGAGIEFVALTLQGKVVQHGA